MRPSRASEAEIDAALAQALVRACDGVAAVTVPMDGFHLSNQELARLGLADRKGAPETFDAAGYVALLRRKIEDDPKVPRYLQTVRGIGYRLAPD